MDPSEDIKFNGIPYRIDITSYREKDLADFSPRASVPTGSVSHSELMLYQPLNMTDWRHGMGFTWHTDAMGYMYTMGNVDTRQPGITMLFTTPTDITDTSETGFKTSLVPFKTSDGATHLFTCSTTGLRKYNVTTGAWSSVYAETRDDYSKIVNCAMDGGMYLFFCPNSITGAGVRVKKMTQAGVITDTGVNDHATDFSWFVMHRGYVYAGKDDEQRIHYASEEDLSDLEGGGPEDAEDYWDPALINVGATMKETIGAVSFGNELYVFRPDGVWVVGSDNLARRVLDYSSETSDDNFRGFAVYNGYLYFAIRHKAYQWSGSRLVDVTPPRMTDVFPYSEIKEFGTMVAADNYLYVLANWYCNPIFTPESTQPDTGSVGQYTSLFCWDGVGWHKLADFDSLSFAVDLSYSTMCYDGANNRLYVSLSSGLVAANQYTCYFNCADPTTYLPSSIASSPYDTTPLRNLLISSRLDMGFRRVKKFSPSIMVEASGVVKEGLTTDRYIVMHCLLCTGEPTYTGTDQVIYKKIGEVTHNGVTELAMPMIIPPAFSYADYESSLETAQPATFNYMILIAEFVANTPYNSPVLEGITVRFLLRPNVFYGYNFNVIAATNYVYGENVDTRTAGQIVEELKIFRDSKQPLWFTDIYGNEKLAYISSITNVGLERFETDEGAIPNIETYVNVNVVEVK